MVQDSKVLVIHQDRFLIPDTLMEIATIFKRAILAKNIETFTDELIHFQHLFANDMCVERGAAALNEWYATAMAVAQGCTVEFKQLVDLAAITSPFFSEFYKNYREGVRIKKI